MAGIPGESSTPNNIESNKDNQSTGPITVDAAVSDLQSAILAPATPSLVNMDQLKQSSLRFVELAVLRQYYKGEQFDADLQLAIGPTGQDRFNALIQKAQTDGLNPRDVEAIVVDSHRLQEMVRRSRTPGSNKLTETELIPEQEFALRRAETLVSASIENLNTMQEILRVGANAQLVDSLPFVNGHTEVELMRRVIRDKAQKIYDTGADKSLTREAWDLGVRPTGYIDINEMLRSRGQETRDAVVELYGPDGAHALYNMLSTIEGRGQTLSPRQASELAIKSMQISKSLEAKSDSTKKYDASVLLPEQEAALSEARAILTKRLSTLSLVQLDNALTRQTILNELPYVDNKSEQALYKELAAQRAQAIYEQSADGVLTYELWRNGARPNGFVSNYLELLKNPDGSSQLPEIVLKSKQLAYKLSQLENKILYRKPLNAAEAAEYADLTQKIQSAIETQRSQAQQ